jgi:hypothetical protein
VPRPPADASPGDFWRELWSRLPAATDADVRVVDSDTLPAPEPAPRSDLIVIEGPAAGDAVAARWDSSRTRLLEKASFRPFEYKSVTEATEHGVVTPSAPATGKDFGGLVHQILEWTPLTSRPEAILRMAEALAPAKGLDPGMARRAADHVVRALALPVMERARKAERVWRELPITYAHEGQLLTGRIDLAFEEDGQLVIVDYKSDAITEDQSLERADKKYKEQLRHYSRALTQALGMHVRDRLVLFTALGRTVAV